MNENVITILGYLIPAVGLIVVQLIISFKQDQVNNMKHDMVIQEIKKDISRLESKQDKHNQLVERMVVAEQNINAQWKWIDQFKDSLKSNKVKEE